MIGSQDTVSYTAPGFDGEEYIQRQKEAILERIQKFTGRLYLEIGGKFLYDPHAARVLPGFLADSKKQIFSSLMEQAEIIFCMNANDIIRDRQLLSNKKSYLKVCLEMIENINRVLGTYPKVAINRVKESDLGTIQKVRTALSAKGIKSYLRYEIQGYPENTKTILSNKGYGRDEYIPIEQSLVLVTGAASSSGKMSTCLGQIYQESRKGIDSGYAKYETFPIWNLPLHHPVNLAYEAATADIGDYNTLDSYHKNAYDIESVNYNRDVEAFEIVMQLAKEFLPTENATRSYASPTDMGINMAGYCISDDIIVQKASIAEISRRSTWYGHLGNTKAKERCHTLSEQASKYMQANPTQKSVS